jgi:hypothetical protein
MKKIFSLTTTLLLIVTSLSAQTKVANYCVGKYGTDKYEHIEFWIKDGKRTEINYSYGKDGKNIKLRYAGKDLINGDSCFKVSFPNNYTLYIVAKNERLLIVDAEGKYNKTFSWEYEGPIDGIGTFCDVCAENEEDAITVVKSAYLK